MLGKTLGYFVQELQDLRDENLTSTQLGILYVLARYAQAEKVDRGQSSVLIANPAIKTMVKAGRFNEKSVPINVRELVNMGYVAVVKREHRNSSHYQLLRPVVYGVEEGICLVRREWHDWLCKQGMSVDQANDILDALLRKYHPKGVLTTLIAARKSPPPFERLHIVLREQSEMWLP